MKRFLPILLSLFFTAALLLHPEEASLAVRGGLILCARTVIPSLFPFFAVTSFLLRMGVDTLLRPIFAPIMGPLFRLRGVCAVPLLAGLTGGYPTGAKTAAELYEQGSLTKGEAELLLGFCNNCGPGFLLGYAGAAVLRSPLAGMYLLAVHCASALVTGMILCRLPRKQEPLPLPCTVPVHTLSPARALTTAVSSALASTLGICAYVVLFQTAAALLPPMTPAILGGVEMVSGMVRLTPSVSGFVAAAGLTAWGGLSVHCQSASVTGDLSLRYHIAGKIMQTIISVLIALFIAKWVY